MTSELERLQLALPKRYTLVRELDRGGMSRVYLARESMPDREVAIKVFDERLSAQLGRERFIREVEVTSQLGHPYIIPIHAAGEAQGALYYVMPFIRGESLRDRLQREGRLPVGDALRITEQVAGALEHAHARGIVHRDIKPANILFHGGHAVVADFGIARAVDAAETKGPVTHAGTTLGTPDYMSPEQITTEGEIDERTDVYALACVLYEMLGGQPPFLSRTRQSTLARHVADTVPQLRGIREAVPRHVESAIRRALSKAPLDRFSSVTEFVQALRNERRSRGAAARATPRPRRFVPEWAVSWRLAGTLLVAAAAGVAWNAGSGAEPAAVVAASPDVVSVAVMPFENRTNDPSLDDLGVIIADEVNGYLTQLPSVRPRALFSVRSLLEADASPRLLMDTLGVSYLIGGSVELRSGALVVRVVETDTTNTQSDNYSFDAVPRGEVNSLLGTIGRDVAGRFVRRRGLQERFASGPAVLGPAREEHLRGEGAMGLRTAEGIDRSVEHFREAVRLDPTYAPAYADLSSAYALSLSYRYDLGEDPYDVAAMALVTADSAVQLDRRLADGYAARGYARVLLGIDLDGAESDFGVAKELVPNDPSSASWSSRLLAARGQVAEAYEQARLARDLDPAQPGRHLALAEMALQARGYDEAIEASRTAGALQPLARAAAREGLALALARRPAECLRLDVGEYDLVRAICLRRSGDEEAAQALAERAERAMESGAPMEPGFLDDLVAELLAAYYADLGDVERAVRWMTTAFEISPLGVDARILGSELFDPVRRDPAFAAALDRARARARDRVLERARR